MPLPLQWGKLGCRQEVDKGGGAVSGSSTWQELTSFPYFSEVPLWEAREANGEEAQDCET